MSYEGFIAPHAGEVQSVGRTGSVAIAGVVGCEGVFLRRRSGGSKRLEWGGRECHAKQAEETHASTRIRAKKDGTG